MVLNADSGIKTRVVVFLVVCFMVIFTMSLTYSGCTSCSEFVAPTKDILTSRTVFCGNGSQNSSDVVSKKQEHVFKIIIITQRRHWSLRRLLNSVQNADYQGSPVSLEIRIDFHTSKDHAKTIELANSFQFRHGEKSIHLYMKKQGLFFSWFNAWRPKHDNERAVILEDDMELSPLWFRWLNKAWQTYGDREDIGGMSLCRQRLNASNGASVMFENDAPFLYRVFGTFGFSPNARYWRSFADWIRRIDMKKTDVRVDGTVTTKWWEGEPNSIWEQYWYWWCFSHKPLYTLYVHSRNGALIAHWAEPGVHAKAPAYPNDKLLTNMEPVLETFPDELEHYGWNFRPEKYPHAS